MTIDGRQSIRMLILAIFLPLVAVSCVTTSQSPSTADSAKPAPKLPPLSPAELRVLHKMGGRVLDDGNIAIGKAKIDRRAKEISFPAKINMADGPIEVLICTPQGRSHESLLISEINPMNLQLAMILSGAVNGARKPPKEKTGAPPQGDLFDVFVTDKSGKRHRVEYYLVNPKKNAPISPQGWVFIGSKFTSTGVCLATREGNVATTWSNGNTILDNPASNGDEDDNISIDGKRGLKVGEKVTVTLRKREREQSVAKAK